MFKKNTSIAVVFIFSFFATHVIADSDVRLNNLPSEAQRIAKKVADNCKEIGEDDATNGDFNKTIDVYRSSEGKRFVIFDPAKICAVRGNGACSTDGCDIFIYSEQLPSSWKLELHQPIFNKMITGGQQSFTLLIEQRGGVQPCKRDPQSTCLFELTWRGSGFSWKHLR